MFTRLTDYQRIIEKDDLLGILEQDLDLLEETENYSIEKIKGYLAHRYDLDQVLIDILPFDLNTYYTKNQLVEYSEPEWQSTVNYQPGDRFSYNGEIYEVTATVQGIEPPNPSYYTRIMKNALLFTVARDTQGNYPDEPFRYVPTCDCFKYERIKGWDRQNPIKIIRQSTILSIYHNGQLKAQANIQDDYEYPKVLPLIPIPDAISLGFTGEIEVLTRVPENQWIEVQTENYFEQRDSRNKVLLDWIIKLTVYEIHSRINPRYIPDLRVKQYDDVMKELEKASKGLINIDLPLNVREENQNVPFIWGSTDTNKFQF